MRSLLSFFLIAAILSFLVPAQAQFENTEASAFREQFIPGNGDEFSPEDVPESFSSESPALAANLFAKAEAQCGGNFANRNFIAVIDFSLHSSQKRLFIKDLRNGSVEALHVAHGSGSDRDNDGYAERFSNVSGSQASSLGCYRTAETYSGKNGRSLRLDGLSSSNSNARSRAVVLHGSNYVGPGRAKQGRSWGCPAIAHAYRDRVITELKGGALLYISN